MKVSFSRFLVFPFSHFLILSVAAILLIPQASAQVVEILDPNLERAIRQELGLSSEVPVTQQEMLKLFSLRAFAMQIENLTGLEYATNLEILILEANRITDLSPLSNLTALQTLRLGHNYIVDISPLTNLTQLTDLEFQDNLIKNVGALSNLTALQTLRLERNYIVDVSPLANLTRLTDLTIANNAIRDFRPLFGLNLQSVDIDIHKLQELVSSEIEIPDPNLERAIRAELGLSSEFPITQQDMLKLFSLSAREAQIENLIGLEYAHNLENLHIPDNPIQDLSPIASLTQLRYLNLSGIRIKDLTFLSNLTQLQKITLIVCRIRDITPLANLTQLISLNIRDNYIVDISPIANLTRLEKLRIDSNSIVDISPLANLTALKELWLDRNRVLDFSPIQGLSLTDFRYDEVCVLPDPPIRDRIKNRSLPSIVQAFRTGIGLSPLSPEDFISLHDIYWTASLFGLHFLQTPLGYTPAGVIEAAIDSREEYLAKNPNMIFLVQIKINSASYSNYPEDWFGWVRDENGKPVRSDPDFRDLNLMDMRLPEVQDIIVQQAVAVSTCGLYDGIMFDWWPAAPFTLTSYNADGSERDHERVEENITLSIVQRIRRAVPDDFLILCNRNRHKLPLSAPYVNGAFMETHPTDREKPYTRADIIEIETNLIWLEQNLREPQINCLKGHGIPTEPPDSPINQQQMRLFTTMSLTLSDGYIVYSTGRWFSDHIWHPFWDADLGQPIGLTAQRYQEDIEGLYIREFTNGWAAYNRSGKAQTISLPAPTTPVSDRGNNAASQTHLLPDLDGEIYLKAKNPADVNGDGQVNVLDLIQVANGLGKSAPDPNGDGVVNILDLTFVARHLGQNAAAPSQLALIEAIPATAKEVIAIQRALNELEAIPNKSHGVQIAIELLRHYLSIAVPNVQETKLLSNYPNPFNPDTWIPYQLSEGCTVTVKIYNVTGSLVRTIQVGHKPAGYYLTRKRAIYWDGRNQNREPVSSGVYFYTFNTDTYTQTRRMVILK